MLNFRPKLLALILAFSLPLLGQYASDAEKGFNAAYTYDISDFDAVSVWTGNLIVHIPIITYPQRGKVSSFGLHLVYNGKSWQQVQPVKTQQANWKFTGNGIQLAYAPAYGLISGSVFDGTSQYFYAQIVDAYGTIHDQGTTGVAMDGSGLANGRDRDGNLYGQWGSIVDLDGNSVTPNLAKDSRGANYLTGWTDTVGRVIPAPPGIQYMSRPGFNAGAGGNDGINTVCTTTLFPGQSGGTVPIDICYSTYTATSNFQQQYVSEGTGVFTAISSVTLPNQTSWSFTYNSWGDLQTITLPTGGTATYQWQTTSGRVLCNCSTLPYERSIQSRTLTPTPGSSTGVITSTYDYSGSSGANTVKVTNSAGDYVIHTGNPETEVKYYDHVSGLLKTVDTTYALSYISPYAIVDNNYSRPALPEIVTTTWPSGQVSKTCIIYDNNTNTTCTGTDAYNPSGPTWTDTNPGGKTHPIVYGSELYRYEYDYGHGAPGPLLRATQHVYNWQSSGSKYLTNNVLNAECLTTLYGPGAAVPVQTSCGPPSLQSNQAAQTINGYDENNGSPQGAIGNLTSVTRWLKTGTSVKSQTVYNSQGMPGKVCDPIDTACANPRIYTYDATGLFPSMIQYPNTGSVQHIERFTYDKNTGELSSQTDQNGQTTGYTYDSMRRLHVVTFPTGGGSETYTFTDTTPAPSFTFQKAINASLNYMETGILDGLGRKVQTQLTSDPANTDYVDTVYDDLGRVSSVSNPYRTKTDPTYGITSFLYDTLGRKVLQTQPDGSFLLWCYNNVKSGSQSNCSPNESANNGGSSWVDVSDEDAHHWQRSYDGLGRLSGVMEPNSSNQPALETDYTSDTLDNLLSVKQWGGPSGSAGAVARSFTYDTLSRLTQSLNPESGWTCYGTSGGATPNGSNCTSAYDANGNLTFKTDARAITISYAFDALNRLMSKRFSNDPGNTPSSCYHYDTSTLGVGRLASEWTQSASAGICPATAPSTGLWSRRSILSYDAMGRILGEQQCTPSNCVNKTPYAPAYTFDLAGNLYTATNGVTSTPVVGTLSFTSPFDAAGRLLSVSSNWNDATHPPGLFSAGNPTAPPCPQSLAKPYTASGDLMNATYGVNLTLNRGYDVRLRTTCEIDTGSLLKNSTGASATVTVTGSEQSK